MFTNGWDEQVLVEYSTSGENLRRARADDYRQLADLLHAVVSGGRTSSSRAEELSEEEIEALKALGYL